MHNVNIQLITVNATAILLVSLKTSNLTHVPTIHNDVSLLHKFPF